jgi:hypothetical protein
MDFTIWVPPAFLGWCRNPHYSKGSQVVSTFRQISGAKFRYINEGYQHLSDQMIESVNGTKIRNLDHLVQIIESSDENDSITFRNQVKRNHHGS